VSDHALALDPAVPYREMRDPPLPAAVRTLALATFAAQREAAGAAPAGAGDVVTAPGAASWMPSPIAPSSVTAAGDVLAAREAVTGAVSEAALASALAAGDAVGGIVAQRDLATALPFNARHTRGAVRSEEVARRRRELDDAFARWLPAAFGAGVRLVVRPAGQWWYPPGTYFGWHTNRAYPGWRLYLSHAEEPGRSFFRYRDPRDGRVVTSLDGVWDLRLFEIGRERHLWHAIYSETQRFSIGWMVQPWSPGAAARVALSRLLSSRPKRGSLRPFGRCV